MIRPRNLKLFVSYKTFEGPLNKLLCSMLVPRFIIVKQLFYYKKNFPSTIGDGLRCKASQSAGQWVWALNTIKINNKVNK